MINGILDGLTQQFGDIVTNIVKEHIAVDIPTAPTFDLTEVGKSSYPQITIEFYLINKDNFWLERNFRFLTAFYAGTQWVHMPGRIYCGK